MSRPLTPWGRGICFILPAQSLVPWIQYWWLSACRKLGKAPNSGFCLFFSFLCDGPGSRGGKNSGLWWLPSPVLEFYWLRASCFLIGKRFVLDQRKAAEVAFMLGWQLAIAYTWREGSRFTGNPALKFWPDSWSYPWSPVPHTTSWSCLQGVSYSFDHSVAGWQVAALV